MAQPTELMNLLATEFSYLLYIELGLDKILEINRRNNSDPSFCASHDYCDSNVVMEAAFRKVYGTKTDIFSEDATDAWNHAWFETKKNDFYTNRSIYLEYVNHYLTTEEMAEVTGLDRAYLVEAIAKGKILHQKIVELWKN